MNSPLPQYQRRGTISRAVGAYDRVIVGPVAASVDITARFGAFPVVPFQALAAIGATQASASAVNQGVVVVSCTTSSQGVRLPTFASAGVGARWKARFLARRA